MANQLLAANQIPALGVVGLAAIPPGKLASHHDFLRLLFHHLHYRVQGFKGIASKACKINCKTKKARCRDQVDDPTSTWSEVRTSCLQLGSPCILAKVKKNWEEAEFPLKDHNFNILQVLNKVKKDFDKKKKNGLQEEYLETLKKTTLNLAPKDWESRILNDRLMSSAQHRAKIMIMRDYLCPQGFR